MNEREVNKGIGLSSRNRKFQNKQQEADGADDSYDNDEETPTRGQRVGLEGQLAARSLRFLGEAKDIRRKAPINQTEITISHTAMEVSGGEVVVHEDGGSSDNITGSLAGNAASNQVVVDALPYIDLGYDEPGVREAVRKPHSNHIKRFMLTQNTW